LLDSEFNPFFIDHGAHPRLPLSLLDLHNSGESLAAYESRLMGLEKEVRALLQMAQQACKEVLDRGRVDTIFQVGDQVLLRTRELLDAAEIGNLRPSFLVTSHQEACAAQLTLPLTVLAGSGFSRRRRTLALQAC
jgi:hypothetical protein